MVIDEGRHLLHCWACNFRWEGRLHLSRTRQALELYERAVEAIEDHGRAGLEFSVASLARGPWWVGWRAAGLAVRDMSLHGLVECVYRGARQQSGRQGACYRWRVVQY
jgi:hypothetical protein